MDYSHVNNKQSPLPQIMGSEPDLKVDVAKALVRRVWRPLRSGFGVLPWGYWFFAIICTLVFSTAYPEYRWSGFGGYKEYCRFGIPQKFVEIKRGENIQGIEVVRNADGLRYNFAFWMGLFWVPGILAWVARWRMPTWPHGGYIAYRYLVVLPLFVLLMKPIQWDIVHMLFFVYPSMPWPGIRGNQMVAWSERIQTMVLPFVIGFFTWGIVRSLWEASAVLARWFCLVVIIPTVVRAGYVLTNSEYMFSMGLINWRLGWVLILLFVLDFALASKETSKGTVLFYK